MLEKITTPDGSATIAVHSYGQPDAPVIVFVHGLGMSSKTWGEVPSQLASQYRTITYDLRGHGKSSTAGDGDYSMDAHVADLQAVLDHVLKDNEKATLAGNSLGGAVIISYADELGSERLESIVFCGSGGSAVKFPGFPLTSLPDSAREMVHQGVMHLFRGTLQLGRKLRRIEPITNGLVRSFAFTANTPEKYVEQVRDDLLATDKKALAGTALASNRRDWLQRAANLEVPSFVMHGDKDPEVSDKQIERMLSLLPRSKLLTLEGAGHMLPLTHTDTVIREIRKWMQEGARDSAHSFYGTNHVRQPSQK